jgi:hypothetical protein
MLDHTGLPNSEAIDSGAKGSVFGELTFEQTVVTDVCVPPVYVVLSDTHTKESVVVVECFGICSLCSASQVY